MMSTRGKSLAVLSTAASLSALQLPAQVFGRTVPSGAVSSLRSTSGFTSRSRTLSSVVLESAVSDVIKAEPASHPAFELVNVEMVDEYTIKCATYRHTKSGAELISAQADDDNKVFGIVFRTPVSDSTGVPHILEHSVLCGSDKYKSKEPFVELLKGSLQTFLNAFTYPDRTCYPVASQNTKDFYNLVNVYLDAVLHPRAKKDPTVLAQEGWHYELEDAAEPLTYKGVVFNEMKGVYSSPDSRMYRASQQLTFPDNSYSVDSGGDPNDIPDLTFEQFKTFHDMYYHPANSRIFFYGDDDLYTRLELLDEYLKDFDAADASPSQSEVRTQKMIPTPRRRVEKYPVAPGEADPTHMVMLSWLLHEEPLTPEDELTLGVLDHLLMGTPTSTLYKPMIESGLGAALMGGGLSDELKQATFSVGLKGVKADDVPKVEDLALSTLKQAVSDGFDADAIEASLNTIEFSMREFNTGGFPKGLSVMLAVMPRWLYGRPGTPADALRFEKPLAALKEKLSSGEKVFEGLLERLLVNNQHLATVELVPDTSLSEEQKQKEEARLAEAKASMSDDDIKGVIRATKELKEAQLKEDAPEDLATIPRVTSADLERTVKTVPTDVDTSLGNGAGTLLTHPLPTAGVVYADVLLDLSKLPLDDLPYVRFLTQIIDELGTSDMDAVQLQRRIGARTGGIATAMIYEQPTGPDGSVGDPMDVVAYFALRGKSTGEKASDLFGLMHALLSDANLAGGQDKAVEMLREAKSSMESSFISSGNSYAGMRLSARNTLLGYIGESTQGVTYYESVKSMLELAKSDWPSLLSKLTSVRDAILTQEGIVINLTADEGLLPEMRPVVDEFVGKLPEKASSSESGECAAPWKESASLLPRVNEGFAITTQVNYVAAGTQLIAPGEAMDGAFYAVARYLSRGYLWDNVRVVGGAYGGGCALNPTSGGFAYSSYRDPNLQGTLDIYGKTAEVLDAVEISEDDLDKAIVGAVGDLDQPSSAQQKGYKALIHHLTGMTTEIRQAYRDQVIATDRDAFKRFAAKLRSKPVYVATFASKEAMEAANGARADADKISITELKN